MSQAEEQAAQTTNLGPVGAGKVTARLARRAPADHAAPATVPESRFCEVDAECAILAEQLAALAQRDERVIVVSLLRRTRMTGISDVCGERFLEAGGEWGEALQWCVRQAGPECRPVVLLCTEALRTSFGLLARELGERRAAVTLVVCRDGPRPENGASGHELSPIPLLRLVEELAIMVPADRQELRTMLELCAQHPGPAALVVRRGLAGARLSRGESFGLGEAQQLTEGADLALVAVGPSVHAARHAVRRLTHRGVKATLVNARFAHPLDREVLSDCARRCRGMLILEDAAPRGGFSSAVLELVAEVSAAMPARVVHLGSDGNGSLIPVGEIVREVEELARSPRNGEHVIGDLTLPATNKPGAIKDQATVQVSSSVLAHNDACIERQALSPTVRRWVDAYSRIGQRTTYLWKWCLHGLELTTLPCVAPEWRAHACDTKLLAVMLGVLLDDVADRPGSTDFLEALVDLVSGTGTADFSSFSAKQQEYAAVTCSLQAEFHERIVDYPCYGVYAELLHFDNLQVWNTMRYADLLNRQLALLNLVEHDLYLTHNMQMMSFATLDLMCSPEFECTELGRVREAIWHAQCMARIGNLVSTWQREIPERDFTSAVFARAVLCGELTPEQLACDDRDRIEAAIRQGRHEEHFLRCWARRREHLRSMRRHIRSFDLGQLVQGLDRLIEMELCSRGRK